MAEPHHIPFDPPRTTPMVLAVMRTARDGAAHVRVVGRPRRIGRADSSETIHNGYANGQITQAHQAPGGAEAPPRRHPPNRSAVRNTIRCRAAGYAARA